MTSPHALPALPTIPGTNYDRVPIDAFRASVAQRVATAWDEDVSKVFAGVDAGKRGADFAVAVPRFKKGNPAEWIAAVVDSFKPDNAIESVTAEGPFLMFQMK